MLTATTAPVRPKRSRFTVIRVGPFEGNVMAIGVRVEDETGNNPEEFTLFSGTAQRNGLAYDSAGGVGLTALVASTPSFLAADFAAFADTAGTFATKALALETRLQSTGRIPA